MTTETPCKDGCLVCGDRNVYSRGLCQKHYRQFKSAFDEFTDPREAEAFETQLLNEGWILPKTAGGRPKSWSPFAEIAEKIKRGSEVIDPALVAEDHDIYEKAKRDKRRRATKKKAENPTRTNRKHG